MMTQHEIRELFEQYRDEYLKFDRVQNPRSKRPDLHAFLVLDELVPSDRDMIACAWHDNIGLSVELGDLAPVVTEEQIVDLIRCGVRINEDDGYHLCMFA